MAIYGIGDLHLSFGVNKPMNIFGENWANYEKKISENWLSKINEEDVVLLPGDFSWAMYIREAKKDFKFIDNLPGTKILLKGNHDFWWSSISKLNAMITKEIKYDDAVVNGFLALFLNLIVLPLLVVVSFMLFKGSIIMFFLLLLFLALAVLMIPGYFSQEPNEARVMVFFGKYKGTFTETGFFWVNPFMNKKKLSLRARNLDVEPIKVNDKIGNPILIGLVLVWKLKDTYKAMFEIDAQTMADNRGSGQMTVTVAGRMNAFEDFVRVQSDAALRQVAGLYAYDDNEANLDELTLRSGGDEINEQLEQKLNERLAMAGMEIVEARINYLAYAPEIAAVMLRRQQASAIISAREKIVEGAVSMVHMALHKLSEEEIVELDEEKKAAMVSNLLVVLCADEAAQPVVNTGTLNH